MPTPVHRWLRRYPLIALFLGVVVYGLALAYGGEIQSCRRTQQTRKTQTVNLGLFRQILWADATRALDYSKVDTNRKGARVNERYAAARERKLKQLEQPDIPDCFPFPEV
jgi:hypothetical protein